MVHSGSFCNTSKGIELKKYGGRFFFLELVPLRSEKHFKLHLQNSIMVPLGHSFQNFFSNLTSKPLLFIWESPLGLWGEYDSHEIQLPSRNLTSTSLKQYWKIVNYLKFISKNSIQFSYFLKSFSYFWIQVCLSIALILRLLMLEYMPTSIRCTRIFSWQTKRYMKSFLAIGYSNHFFV